MFDDESFKLTWADGQAHVDAMIEQLRPPARLTPFEALETHLWLPQVIGSPVKFSGDRVPYWREPSNALADTTVEMVVAVGPAQSAGKTAWLTGLALCWAGLIKRMDCNIVQMSKDEARTFSNKRIKTAIMASPTIRAAMDMTPNKQNVHDKTYKAGHTLALTWPTVKTLASKSVPLMLATDRDRMSDDIDGQGDPIAMMLQRIKAARALGKLVAESTPGRVCDDPTAEFDGHMLAPVAGIVGDFNSGDRRWLYVECPKCSQWFHPSYNLMQVEATNTDSAMALAETAHIVAPCCKTKLYHRDKPGLLAGARWVPDGVTVLRGGGTKGAPLNPGPIRSFHIPALLANATDVSWPDLWRKNFQAEQAFERTGSEEGLKDFNFNDLAQPYVPKQIARIEVRTTASLRKRAAPLPAKTIWPDTRLLLAAIDTQKDRFEVLITGVGPDLRMGLVDRFSIRHPRRRAYVAEAGLGTWLDEDGLPVRLPDNYRENSSLGHDQLSPHVYEEDWFEIYDAVMRRTYALPDGSGRQMAVSITTVDSQGTGQRGAAKQSATARKSTTALAYQAWRRFKLLGAGRRIVLAQGQGDQVNFNRRLYAPNTSGRSDRGASSGDVPVFQARANHWKTTVSNMLARDDGGPGSILLPEWFTAHDRYPLELTAEHQDEGGAWINPKGARNETWDLMYWTRAMADFMGLQDLTDWNDPPKSLANVGPWDSNPMVFMPGQDAHPIVLKPQDDLRSQLEKLASSI